MDSVNHLPNKTRLTSENNEYIIVKVLGQGGFGIVYGAWNKQKQKVAIKEYFPFSFATRSRDTRTVTAKDDKQDTVAFFAKGVKRFYEEAQTMKRFNDDKNIVDILDFFYANGTAYIVMEFIEGQTFMSVLKAMPQGRLTLADVLANISAAVDALERIHNTPWKDNENKTHSGLIHRDISPDNIMFSSDGSVKLLDFGAARTVSMQGEYVLTGIVKPGYAPAEQFIGSGVAGAQGPWTDVYALAATIYRAITGKVPPSSIQRQAKDTLVPPSAMGVPILPQQETVLLKGLAMDYRERYQSIRQFYKELSIEATPPPTPRPSLWDGLISWVKSLTGQDSSTKGSGGNKVAWGIAAVAVVSAIFFYSSMNAATRNLDSARQELSNQQSVLARYSYIEQHFGHGSDTYYSEKAIAILNTGGASTKIPIYWGFSGKASISCSDDISVKWGDFNNNRADVTVTSSNKKGFYPVHFKNDKNNDNFDVLVIVK